LTLEKIEGLAAVPALPEVANRGMGFARRTGKVVSARQLGEAQQGSRVLQSAPAIHEHENGDGAEPKIARPQRNADECCHTYEPQNRGHHQAAGAAQHKPE
jgi:hypothetical protein